MRLFFIKNDDGEYLSHLHFKGDGVKFWKKDIYMAMPFNTERDALQCSGHYPEFSLEVVKIRLKAKQTSKLLEMMKKFE